MLWPDTRQKQHERGHDSFVSVSKRSQHISTGNNSSGFIHGSEGIWQQYYMAWARKQNASQKLGQVNPSQSFPLWFISSRQAPPPKVSTAFGTAPQSEDQPFKTGAFGKHSRFKYSQFKALCVRQRQTILRVHFYTPFPTVPRPLPWQVLVYCTQISPLFSSLLVSYDC